jgi:hypothetical protein
MHEALGEVEHILGVTEVVQPFGIEIFLATLPEFMVAVGLGAIGHIFGLAKN